MSTLPNPDDFLLGIASDSLSEFGQAICERLRELTPRYDWVGIYWVDGDALVLGPWSGRAATEHTRIPVSQGVCGAAVRESRTVIVDDVKRDPRYLSCFVETRSEIVVPIQRGSEIIGEIDIDGREIGAYTENDRVFLERLAERIAEKSEEML